MKMPNYAKIIAAVTAAAVVPVTVTALLSDPADVNRLMAAAITFTSQSGYITEPIEFGGGNLILYKPSPQPPAEEATAEPSETAAETPSETTSLTTEEQPLPTDTTEEQPAASDPPPSSYIITQNISPDEEDLTVFNNRDGMVEEMTFHAGEGANFITLSGGAQVRNCTELDNDFVAEQTKLLPDIKIDLSSEEPQVLIMHTHTTESYLVDGSGYYDNSYTSRTTDASQSVVAVGQRIAEKLAENGICVIHDGTLHDYPYFDGAYARSQETVKQILAAYPSIKVVLDIHRDGIEESDGTRVAAVTEINGREAAQVMIISAAQDDYYDVPNYLENFRFACLLQTSMETLNPGLTRPILFQYCQYNQHLTTGSLLIEVGSHGNTLEQALYTGELIGESIAQALLSLTD
ncbi:MAG: stage II sporulation protein P [Oscillospiraceae bacterium]|nr:stage II sporulation protein P [Oscillospiraceae bacterium]